MKNKYLSVLFSFFVLLSLASCSINKNENKPEEIVVFADGQTDYSFIVGSNVSADAKNFVNTLASISGTGASVFTDVYEESPLEILVGQTNREATGVINKTLNKGLDTLRFQFIIAESSGKVVVLADAAIGYVYALEHIKENYIKDGKFVIEKGTLDVQKVLWDEYYATDLYKQRLEAELEEQRKEDAALSAAEAERYKKLAASFDLKDFCFTYSNKFPVTSSISSLKNSIYTIFTDYNGTNLYRHDKGDNDKYETPEITPTEDEHPRIYFTPDTVEEVKKNLTADESSAAYKRYMSLSDLPFDGKFTKASGDLRNNYDAEKAARIEAKAFRYAMTGEEKYGYQAIYAAKNAILTIDVSRSVSNYCRSYGNLMYVAACVYDWCYDLMTEEDKYQIIAACVSKLGYVQEVVSQGSGYVNNLIPCRQGAAYGHGSEDQLLQNYLAFAIACYDECPEIYELVGGRVFEQYIPFQNYLGESGSFWEGTMYGSVRGVCSMIANLYFNKMTNGAASPFLHLQKVITSTAYYIRPDNFVYIIGDTNQDVYSFQYVWMANNCFYAGNLYGDTYLKSIAYKYLDGFTRFSNMGSGLSAVQFLALNDPSVSHIHEEAVPLTYTSTYPYTTVFTKSKNDDEDAFGLFMTMNEFFDGSHMHAECGSFQLFYKGALITESGAYKYSDHYYQYLISSVAANTVLVYNQNLAKQWQTQRPSYVSSAYQGLICYTGGQKLSNAAGASRLEQFLNHPQLGQRQSLGTKSVEKDGVLVYSYLGGDMTGAYDEESVDEVSRYMMAVATGDKDCPYAFLTFDRITSDDASYHKAALIHVQEEPTETSDGFIIVTNTKGSNNGKLVLQNVGYDADYVIWGGEGREFWIPGFDENGYSLEAGFNASLNESDEADESTLAEYGWGRVEISPAKGTEQKTNHILTVMYVTDADSNAANIKAKDLCTDTLSGTEIFGKAVFFPKNEKLLSSAVSFTLDSSADTCYIAGVDDGTWTIKKDGNIIKTVTVAGGRYINGDYADGEHIITFAATGAGTYTITPES